MNKFILNNYAYFAALYIIIVFSAEFTYAQLAIIKSFVADMGCTFPAVLSPASPNEKSCLRAHQGLYNEVINCHDCSGDFYKLTYNNIIYGFDDATNEPLKALWVHKQHIALLQELTDDVVNAMPDPIYGNKPTIVLTYPWQSFSVGTRFKHIPENDLSDYYAIIRFDHISNTIINDSVPKKFAMQEIQRSASESRAIFVNLINSLIDNVSCSGEMHVIAYVWGGSSFIKPYVQPAFYCEDGAWQRDGSNNPYTGYDCSEFVMRMAQISGLNFPWKTTGAIKKALKELGPDHELENGDLILVNGHVMIASNISANEIIHSQSYSSGYGCVHRITLDKCFDCIRSYKDLVTCYRNGTLVRFKNKNGEPMEKTYVVTLLRLTEK